MAPSRRTMVASALTALVLAAADPAAATAAEVDTTAYIPPTPPPRCTYPAAYEGKNGVVAIEAEWQLPTDKEGPWSISNRFAGNGRPTTPWPNANATFIVYKANSQSPWVDSPPPDKPGHTVVLDFPFTIDEPGYYRLLLRSAAPHPTEHNDAWVRLPVPYRATYGFIRRRWAGEEKWQPLRASRTRGYVKAYQNQGGETPTFHTFTVDHNPSVIVTRWLIPGSRYVVQVAGRSTQWALDRVVLFRCQRDEGATCLDHRGEDYRSAIGAESSRCQPTEWM